VSLEGWDVCAASTYLRNIYLLSVASPLLKKQFLLTADWLLPGFVCNQSDGAVGGTMLETE